MAELPSDENCHSRTVPRTLRLSRFLVDSENADAVLSGVDVRRDSPSDPPRRGTF